MSALPFFYHHAAVQPAEELWLGEDTARHVVQVLRMQPGEQLMLADGKGTVALTTIAKAEKKKCSVLVQSLQQYPLPAPSLHLAVAFTKNTARNEWLLEKVTEMGVHTITPLLTSRTERERIRYDRWTNILVSAMLQSQQYHLPELREAAALKKVLEQHAGAAQKLVAHCMDGYAKAGLSKLLLPAKETLILIGPEGDFTREEVDLCLAAGCRGVSLGRTRLRTETAAMVACAYFNQLNDETV